MSGNWRNAFLNRIPETAPTEPSRSSTAAGQPVRDIFPATTALIYEQDRSWKTRTALTLMPEQARRRRNITPEQILEKLTGHAQWVKRWGATDGMPTLHPPDINPRWRENGPDEPVEITGVTLWLDEDHVLVEIEADGTMTVEQNWSEVGQKEKHVVKEEPSPGSIGMLLKTTSWMEGRKPHPPVEWTTEIGPWVKARMNGEVIFEAGVPKGPQPKMIILPGKREAKTFQEAERLLNRVYFPQYTPIDISTAQRALMGT